MRSPHPRYRGFVDYGDGQGFRDRLAELRAAVRTADAATPPETPEAPPPR